MTRADVRELAADQAFPRMRIDSRTVSGPRAWCELARTAPSRELNKFAAALLERAMAEAQRPTQREKRETPPAPAQHSPTAAHWRAVGDALEKFCGLGRWSYRGRRTLPHFELRWDDPQLPRDKAAVTAFFADGSIVIALRSDLPPQRVHECMLHELQHVADVGFITDPLSIFTLEDIEARARSIAAQLAPL